MQALVIHRYGGPAVMSLEDRPAPAVGPRDVLIDVRAASLNPIDYKLRQGKSKLALRLPFPIGLGCDVAGVVAAVGAEVTRFAVGDEVFARLEKDRMGGLAEQVAADEAVVAARPRTATFEEAASLPLAGLTALQALREAIDLQPGQRVLIHAGAGGVGSLAIQIAKRMGAHVVTTCSTRNVELVRGLGADEVIDYTQQDVAAHPRDLDAVFDTLGGASELTSLRLVKPGGVVVGVSGLPDAAFARAWLPGWVRPALWLLTGKRRRVAAAAGARFQFLFMRPDGAQLADVAAWVDAGELRPLIHATFPLADVAAAFAELERGRARGKIVVTIGAAPTPGG
ncbi:MAG: NADP-dependent oxidoreductase [Kofleriaceae bacterium]|nr:NADP-dependent oxidoreductase [Kofleriaceae bacterium]